LFLLLPLFSFSLLSLPPTLFLTHCVCVCVDWLDSRHVCK
jgi:hypothetical protein